MGKLSRSSRPWWCFDEDGGGGDHRHTKGHTDRLTANFPCPFTPYVYRAVHLNKDRKWNYSVCCLRDVLLISYHRIIIFPGLILMESPVASEGRPWTLRWREIHFWSCFSCPCKKNDEEQKNPCEENAKLLWVKSVWFMFPFQNLT